MFTLMQDFAQLSTLEKISSPTPCWKVDLHLHCAEDLLDAVDFSAEELLYRAHRLGFSAIAFTLHHYFFSRPELIALAERLGLLLVPGVELRLEGADVVVLNIREEEMHALQTFDDLRRLKEQRGEALFIFAPHPLYGFGGSMGRARLLSEIDLFDAIEQCHFHTALVDRNRPALEIATEYSKPVLATSDAHRLSSFGRHYTLVQPCPDETLSVTSLFRALRAGRGKPVSPAVSLWGFINYAVWVLLVHDLRVRLERA